MNRLEEILAKHFGERNVKYYNPCDAISNENFIRWSYFNHDRNRILLSLGSNDGYPDIKIFEDAEELDVFIKIVIF